MKLLAKKVCCSGQVTFWWHQAPDPGTVNIGWHVDPDATSRAAAEAFTGAWFNASIGVGREPNHRPQRSAVSSMPPFLHRMAGNLNIASPHR